MGGRVVVDCLTGCSALKRDKTDVDLEEWVLRIRRSQKTALKDPRLAPALLPRALCESRECRLSKVVLVTMFSALQAE
jgi:hypothetical protein